MTSSIRWPRSPRAFRSPSAQRMASTRFDLPLPLGPTIAVMPRLKGSSVRRAKVLNPCSCSDFRYTGYAVIGVAGLSRPSKTYTWTTARVTTCIRACPRCPWQRAVASPHASRPKLRRIDIDLGCFDGDPHLIAAVEPELAHRGRCHLGNDRRQACEPHAHALALEAAV